MNLILKTNLNRNRVIQMILTSIRTGRVTQGYKTDCIISYQSRLESIAKKVFPIGKSNYNHTCVYIYIFLHIHVYCVF
jgi:hypothetical protein